MRPRTRPRLLLAAPPLVMALLVARCSPTPAQKPPDDLQLPAFDASAITLDAGALPVSVTVLSGGAPEPDVLVAFQDASGAVLGTTKTDTRGTASQVVAAGSQVTVFLGSPASGVLAIYTYVGVEPGDALGVVDPNGSNGVSATINAVPPNAPNGTTGFLAHVGRCGTFFNAPPGALYLSRDCLGNGKFPLLVLAQDQGPPSFGYAFSKGNTVSDPDAGAAVLDLSAGKWATTVGTWKVTPTNAPASSTQVAEAFTEIANGIGYVDYQSPFVTGDAGPPPSSFETHPGYADAVQSEASAMFDSGNFTDTEIAAIATRTAAPALDGSATLDLSKLLPTITSAASDFTSSASRPTITWTPSAPLDSATGTFVHVDWTQQGDGGTGGTSFTWDVIVPASATSLQMPAFPPEAAAWTPNGALLGGDPTPTVVTVDGLTGYAELRKIAATFPPPNLYMSSQPPFIPPLPKDGTVRLTLYGPYPG